jgi:MFS family permease
MTRSPLRILPLLMAILFISHFNRVSMSVAGATYLIPEVGISPVRMGAIYSIFLLCYTVSMTPVGLFADRAGPWLPLTVMLLGTGALGILTGLSGVFIGSTVALWATLLVVRGAMGVFTAPLHPSTARVVAGWIPPDRRILVNGLVTPAAGVGIAGTIYLFGGLQAWLGWEGAFMVSGGVTLAVAGLWFWFGGDSPAARRAKEAPAAMTERVTLSKLIANRSVLLLTLSYSAMGYFEYIFFYWMQYYFGSILHLDSSTTNLYSTIPLLSFAAGMPVGGSVGDRLERRFGVARGRGLVPFTGMLLGAAGLAAGIVVKDPVAVVVCFSVAMLAIGAVEPQCWTAAVELGGSLGTTAAGLMNTGGNLAGFLAPIVTPWLSLQFGWGAGLGLGALVCFLGAACWRWIRLPDR